MHGRGAHACIEANADSVWLLPIVLVGCVVDGLLPPAPAEPALVAIGAVAAATSHPNIPLLILVAAVGAFIGDNLAYSIGRYTRLGELRKSRRPEVRAFFTWVGEQLRRRGGMIIMACRYVPGGRQVVNLTAGAMEFPRSRSIHFDTIAVTTWAADNVGIGAVAGTWLEDQPLWGAVLGVAFALVLGWLAERGAQRWGARRPGPLREGPGRVGRA